MQLNGGPCGVAPGSGKLDFAVQLAETLRIYASDPLQLLEQFNM